MFVYELDRILDLSRCVRDARELILSIIAASVVDFPDPVGPVTSTRPRGRSRRISRSVGGRPSSWKDRISNGIVRIAIATVPRWRNTLPRKRDRFWTANDRSSSSFLLEPLFLLLREYRCTPAACVSFGRKLLGTESHHPTVDAQLRTLAHADVQVRGASGDHLIEERSHPDAGRLFDSQSVRDASLSIIVPHTALAERGARPYSLMITDQAAVSLITSSSVVIPRLHLQKAIVPERNVSIPSSTA